MVHLFGEIKFRRAQARVPSWCACCPPFDNSVPHPHIYSRDVFMTSNSSVLLVSAVKGELSKLSSQNANEGKTVRITIEVI